MPDFAFGIDLGTTYSCIAYAAADGTPIVLPNSEGSKTTPSVVQFLGNEVIVGTAAKESAMLYPEQTAAFVKRLIGKSDVALEVEGKPISPTTVSSFILRKLALDAEEQLGAPVHNVVITCPAYFGAAERDATRLAGEMAGLHVLRIINEPTAAALYYGCIRANTDRTVLVYDLGGGTFDVTIIRIEAGKEIRVVVTDGDHSLGGKDWDDSVVEYLKSKFRELTGYADEFELDTAQDLLLKAETIKKTLSSRESTRVTLNYSGLKCQFEMTRADFDLLTQSLTDRTIDLTRAVIDAAKAKGVDTIDDFLLVGGSTRMPQVRETLLRAMPEYDPKVLEPDEAVAKGAALQSMYDIIEYTYNPDPEKPVMLIDPNNPPPEMPGDELLGATPLPAMRGPVLTLGGEVYAPPAPDAQPIRIVDVTAKSFAIRAIVKGVALCYNMILKNDEIPCEKTETFGTEKANAANVRLQLYESDITDHTYEIDESYKIGELLLENLPANLPAGSPIEVSIGLSKEGIITLRGVDKTGNREIEGTFQSQYAMTREQISDAITFMGSREITS